MKRLLLIPILLLAGFSFGQIVDQFTYTGAVSSNGWLTHSGTAGQIVVLTTPSDNGNSLSYSGLAASTGNRTTLVAGNGEDVNRGVTGITGTGYYSFLLKVTNTTGLTATGDYFTAFGNVNTTGLTNYAARVFIKTGVAPNTFKLGIQNTTGGAPTQTYTANEYPAGTTVFVVVKLNTTVSPYMAEIFMNPVPGAAEPVSTASNNSGTAATFTTFGSVALRQAGNATSGTGNLEIDEIRAGSTWASVTPAGVVNCNTTSTISASACTSYTVPSGDETYFASGTYMDTIPNAALCDSVITINLTITGPTMSTISPSACTSYTVPSGDETYFASGTYMDTIPNHLGCDSIITVNLTIVTSITYYADTDTDGLGDPNNTTTACTQPGGFVTNSNDCNDNNASIGAATTWYLDNDTDGYGGSTSITNCIQPVGYVSNNTDCDDNNINIHPGATEIANNGIDEDCSGGDLVIAPATLGQYQFTGNDCTAPVWNVTAQPANATFSDYNVSGGQTCAQAANVINFSGWNTSGVIDPTQYYSFTLSPASCYGLNLTTLKFSQRASSGAPTVTVRSSLDNFTADLYTGTVPNTITPVTVTLPAAYNTVYGAIEFRFYITSMGTTGATYRHDDVSLLGFINALATQTFYADMDGDGYGDAAMSVTNCVPPAGYVTDNTDCNDNSALEHPGAVWAIDNDGDGFVGSATQVSCTQPLNYISATAPADCDDNNSAVHGQNVYYADVDMDGFGNLNDTVMDCTQPTGYVTNSTDCDDNDNTVGAASVQYYADADNDGYGDPNNFIYACSAQTGYVANFDDCNDTNPAVHPGATEVCDGVDNDCDNSIDEGVPTFTFYADNDNDGLGDPNNSVTDCSTPAGYVGNHSDCDDTDPTPGAGATVFYMDSDNDGYGDETNSISACTAPNGYTATGGDCNDANDAIHPGATDIPANSIDENCDGVDGYLGISEMSISSLVAYPNPGTASVTVTFKGAMENATVRFLGVDGKAVNVGKTEISTSGIVVSTLNLVPGVYFIEVTQGNATQTVRWVKQ